MSERLQFTTAVSCPGCGNTGDARWEENAMPGPKGLRRSFLGISSGFHHEPRQQNMSGEPQLICDECGANLPD